MTSWRTTRITTWSTPRTRTQGTRNKGATSRGEALKGAGWDDIQFHSLMSFNSIGERGLDVKFTKDFISVRINSESVTGTPKMVGNEVKSETENNCHEI